MNHVHLPLTPEWLLWPLPWAWLLILVPLTPLLWFLWLRPARQTTLRFSTLALAQSASGVWRARARRLLPLLRNLALAALLIAAARPQAPNQTRRVNVEGIAIEMILDTSTSMLDVDLAPRDQRLTRLDVIKAIFRDFVTGGGSLPGRPNDLIGLIRFARYPDSLCPLTLDRPALLDVVADLHTIVWRDAQNREHGNRQEDGTAIGDALALGVERLKDLKRTTGSGQQLVIHSRIIILLTDGEDNASTIPPAKAGELAATYGIRVYTVLAGTGEYTPFGRRPVNDTDLRKIAEVSGGKFYQATDKQTLEKIYADIDRLERTQTEEQSYVEWAELAAPVLGVAFAALALQAVLEATWLRKIP